MNSAIFTLFTWLLLGINSIGFVTVAVDKYRAKKKFWRISERTFFILCLLGASPGVYLGCLVIRHKTRHRSFMLGIPAILLVQAAAAWFLWLKLK